MAHQGGSIARNARLELEQRTGKAVVSPLNVKAVLAKQQKKELEE